MTTNANIKQLSILIDPTDDLNDSLNAFDKVISDTFGDEVAHITHELWLASRALSLSTMNILVFA